MKLVPQVIPLLLALLSNVYASWQYLSRPDLSTPILNITHTPNDSSSLAPGYLFIAPFSGSSDHDESALPHQPGPYIYDMETGEVVWTGFAQYTAGWTVNLQKTIYKGADALFAFEGKHNAAHGHGHGHLTVLDSSYKLLTTVRAGHHRLMDKHEGQLIHDGHSALIQIYHPVPIDGLSRLAAREGKGNDGKQDLLSRNWVVDAQFQEVDVNSGNVIFEWHSLDHVPVHHSNISLFDGQAGDGTSSHQAWDYFHINSVDKNNEGDYLLSARDVNSIYKISGKTGKIIWALGGRNQYNNDFKALDDHVAFSYQHHARFQGYDEKGRQLISLYDNSAHGTETDQGSTFRDVKTSCGKMLALDTSQGIRGEWTVETIQAYYPPFHLLSKSQGSTHVFSGGNVLVNWGSEGAVTEYNSLGNVLWHAFLESGKHTGKSRVQNYRAFKFEWTGRPKEEAAVAGLAYIEGSNMNNEEEEEKEELILAASWNGDTEVRQWEFIGRRKRESLSTTFGREDRKGFETRLLVKTTERVEEVQAIGIDGHGNILTRTRWEQIDRNRPFPPSYKEPRRSSHLVFQKGLRDSKRT